jgi:hypothetical protein
VSFKETSISRQLTQTSQQVHYTSQKLRVFTVKMAPNDKAGRVVFIGNIPYGIDYNL